MIIDRIVYDNLYTGTIEYSCDPKNIDINYIELKSILNNFYDLLKENSIRCLDGALPFPYDCLCESIRKSNFTSKQAARLHKWFSGYSEVEIAHYFKISTVTVHKSLMASFRKIVANLCLVIEERFMEGGDS